jgi:hypothetical protein
VKATRRGKRETGRKEGCATLHRQPEAGVEPAPCRAKPLLDQ